MAKGGKKKASAGGSILPADFAPQMGVAVAVAAPAGKHEAAAVGAPDESLESLMASMAATGAAVEAKEAESKTDVYNAPPEMVAQLQEYVYDAAREKSALADKEAVGARVKGDLVLVLTNRCRDNKTFMKSLAVSDLVTFGGGRLAIASPDAKVEGRRTVQEIERSLKDVLGDKFSRYCEIGMQLVVRPDRLSGKDAAETVQKVKAVQKLLLEKLGPKDFGELFQFSGTLGLKQVSIGGSKDKADQITIDWFSDPVAAGKIKDAIDKKLIAHQSVSLKPLDSALSKAGERLAEERMIVLSSQAATAKAEVKEARQAVSVALAEAKAAS